jgi:hypothetical protein
VASAVLLAPTATVPAELAPEEPVAARSSVSLMERMNSSSFDTVLSAITSRSSKHSIARANSCERISHDHTRLGFKKDKSQSLTPPPEYYVA